MVYRYGNYTQMEMLPSCIDQEDDNLGSSVAMDKELGKFKIAREFIEQIQRNDPLNLLNSGNSIIILGCIGDTQRAEEEYEWGEAVFGDNF